MEFQIMSVILTLCVGVSVAFPIRFSFDSDENFGTATTWLHDYGYIGDSSDSDSAEMERAKVGNGIAKMKRFFHITPIDDKMTGEVRELMAQPRCRNGDPLEDDDDEEDGLRFKRFSKLGNSVWEDMPVRISFKSFMSSSRLSSSIQRQIALECADLWAADSGLSFQLVSGRSDIEIEYERMDGHFGTVGVGQSPTPWNDSPSYLRMDSSDKWKPRTRDSDGVSFKAALCHEMGHTLGLGHSGDKKAVMYPSIQNDRDDGKLGSDDIRGIQELYGSNENKKSEERPDPPSPNPRKTSKNEKKTKVKARQVKKRQRQQKRQQRMQRKFQNRRRF